MQEYSYDDYLRDTEIEEEDTNDENTKADEEYSEIVINKHKED